MNSKLSRNQNEAKERAIHDAREKLKNIIKKNNKFNLRDLSRILKKNDAYLQQYFFRGTPKILPEETRFKLSQILDINIDANSKITANALTSGAGGTIVAWSDIKNSNSFTRVSGTLQAKVDGRVRCVVD